MFYVYDLRFQPFNKENMEELLWLINNIPSADRIIIGVVLPAPTQMDSADLTSGWRRFRKEYNPLSYWQRYQIIMKVIQELNCAEKIAGIVPLPRPSVNMKNAENYLPPKTERILCVPLLYNDALEETKISGLESQGEQLLEIPAYNFKPEVRIIFPELITCLIALNDNSWKQYVPNVIIEYLDEIDIVSLVTKNFLFSDAKEALRKIYAQIKEPSLKSLMDDRFSKHLEAELQHSNIKKMPRRDVFN